MTLAKPEQRVAPTTEQRRADLARRWQMIDRVVDRDLERRKKREKMQSAPLSQHSEFVNLTAFSTHATEVGNCLTMMTVAIVSRSWSIISQCLRTPACG